MWRGSGSEVTHATKKAIFDRHFTTAPLAYAAAYHVGEIIISNTGQLGHCLHSQ